MNEAQATLIDTHAHLNDGAFKRDRRQAIERARRAGVSTIINVGYDLATSRLAIDLAEQHDGLYATVGLHPHDAKDLSPELLAEFRALCTHPKVVAVGETGLDFYRDLSPRPSQADAFRRLIGLARDVNLPLVIHDRDAHEEVLTILHEDGAAEIGGVLHCYSGGMPWLDAALKLGFAIGIDGPVTYTNADELRSVATSVPLDRLLLETDCPWLTPKSRGRERNEPAFLTDTAAKVAEVRKVPVAQLALATTDNAEAVFPGLAVSG